jgi:hypothetical protein
MAGTEITITAMGESHFGVQVTEGDTTTSHEVDIPGGFRDEVLVGDLADVADEQVVRETFAFLLEREPATAIMREFSLDVVGRFFPEYVDDLRTRLTASV